MGFPCTTGVEGVDSLDKQNKEQRTEERFCWMNGITSRRMEIQYRSIAIRSADRTRLGLMLSPSVVHDTYGELQHQATAERTTNHTVPSASLSNIVRSAASCSPGPGAICWYS